MADVIKPQRHQVPKKYKTLRVIASKLLVVARSLVLILCVHLDTYNV